MGSGWSHNTCGLSPAFPQPDKCALFSQFLNLSSSHLQLLCWSLTSLLKVLLLRQIISDPRAASSHLWPSANPQKTLLHSLPKQTFSSSCFSSLWYSEPSHVCLLSSAVRFCTSGLIKTCPPRGLSKVFSHIWEETLWRKKIHLIWTAAFKEIFSKCALCYNLFILPVWVQNCRVMSSITSLKLLWKFCTWLSTYTGMQSLFYCGTQLKFLF